jgi:hypothetical protein
LPYLNVKLMRYFRPMLGNSWIAFQAHTLSEAIVYRVKRILNKY